MDIKRIRMNCIPRVLLFLFVSFASLRGGEPPAAPAGVTTSKGMKPFAWPKELVRLEFGNKTRYRNTEFYLRAYLDDGIARIQVTQGDKVISDVPLFDCGQFAILDVDSPLPVLQMWGERYDELVGRHLLVPVRNQERLNYQLCYTEFYTPEKQHALSSEPQQIQLRKNAKKNEVYFLGHLTATEPKEAAKSLKEAMEFKWDAGTNQVHQPTR
jgi:hypothetical protein